MTTPGDQHDPDPDPDPEANRGLARERTNLAWTRTAISFAAAGAAILKSHLVPGLIVLALGLVTWGLRRVFPAFGADDASRQHRLLLVTICVTAVAVVALVVALTARPSVR
jgi:uncharacterized membrane protein YidH (DUF202 family)